EYVHPDPDYYGKRINLSSHPDGMMIGPSLLSAEFVECNADKVIAIETGGLFTRFIAEKVHRKFNAILVHTAGQAPRSTRRFIRRLNVELGLPVYILTDADPWGMHIAMVIISGSANAAHIPELNTPDAKWIGVWATDITKYKLPTESMDEKDLARLETLKKDPRYNDIFWAREINEFIRLKRKAEQQSFSKYGLS
ncbi:MAG: DNA topoisomerase IV subunit A, partial [Nitrososphaerota archaeon]|nr:DNA topoisomerase IV subunit A [Candidatus Bathyarchaeota archaeon]MDW8194607.1 DNA topoisomerase IV subunit A [Nitrososphaerota archaeon]